MYRGIQLPKVVRTPHFLHFWLGNELRATTASTFLTSQLPKVVREWCAFYILTWKCASRHNSVDFFISHLASWLRTRRFSDLQSHKSLEKRSESRLSYLFAHLHLFSSLIFSLLFFSSLTLPTRAFPTVHIVGSFTSKLPSIIFLFLIWSYLHIFDLRFQGRHYIYSLFF